MMTRMICLAVFALSLFVGAGTASAVSKVNCMWEGNAPMCNGKCRSGYRVMKRSKKGPKGAKKCVTGTKVHCCKAADLLTVGKAPFCNAKCPKGTIRVSDSTHGQNGKKCVTGKAAVCVKQFKLK